MPRVTRAGANMCAAAIMLSAACLGSAGCDEESPTEPSSSAVVTFRVVGETFRVQLTTAEQVAAARAAQAGGGARIPVGLIVSGTQVNAGWSWHLEEVSFAEAAIELCDGLPSHVESQGAAFGAGTYCPWSAQVTAIDER